MSRFVSTAGRPGAARGGLLAFAAALGMVLASLQAAGAADAYLLGPLDKLKVRIAEWQTANATFRDWSAVSGDYTVGSDGTISLPFVGAVEAAGKTTADVARSIGDELQQSLGLIDHPSASVEIEQYRPVYLAGDVQTPGQYPFQPGLTVLKAVSLAGGLRHDSNGSRPERDFINARGDYDVLVAKRNQLLAEKARLEAEAAGKKTVDTPAELAKAANADDLMANQKTILDVDNRNKTLKLQAIRDLKDLLHSEIGSLEKKGGTQEDQLARVQKQLEGIGNLADKGLVVNSRVLSLQTQVADLQSRLLDLDTTRLQARQDLNKADQDRISFENEQDSQQAQQLQDASEQLREVEHKLSMNRDLMLEAVLQSAATGGDSGPDTTYAIIRRQKDGSSKTIAADESTPVLPGDVIKTKMDLSFTRNG